MSGDQPIKQKESDNWFVREVYDPFSREVEVLSSGVGRSFKHAIENPKEQLMNLGISGAFGAGMALIAPEARLLNIGKSLVVGSMLAHAGLDGGRKLGTTWGAMQDTWSSADNIERNKNLISQSLGQLAVDTAVSTAGGLGGAKLAGTVHLGYDTFRMNRITETQLGKLYEYHPESALHSRRVGEMSVATGKELGIQGLELQKLKYAAMLHDIGKLDTPLEILGGHGKLTPTEYEVMKMHATDSFIRINEMGVPKRFSEIAAIAKQHHENIDGSGYPDKLVGEQIHPLSKIITVNDVHDALSSTRGYKPRLEIGNVASIMADKANIHYDPVAFDAHMRVPADFMVRTMDFGVGRSTAQSLKLFKGKTWGETLKSLNNTQPSASELNLQRVFDKIYTNHDNVPGV